MNFIKIFIYLWFLNVMQCYRFAPISKYTHKIKENDFDNHIVERSNVKKKDTICLLLLTGGSAKIPPQIYNHLMDSLASVGFSIYTPNSFSDNRNELINELFKIYSEVIPVGHSSGGTTAINYAKNSKIKRMILIDPVDTRVFSSKTRGRIHQLENLESIMFLKAEKSYKFTFSPPGIPFIPFLAVTPNILKLKDCKIIEKEAKNFGHSDILDLHYSNIMHNTRISVGHHNRTFAKMEEYHNWITNHFYHFSKYKYSKVKRLKEIC